MWSADIGVGVTLHTGKQHHYYMCQKKLRTKECKKSVEKKDFIEWHVCEQTIKYLLSDDRLNFIVDSLYKEIKDNPFTKEVNRIQDEINRLNLEVDQLTSEWIGAPKIVKDKITDRCNIIEKQLADLEINLCRAKTKVKMNITKDDIKNWLKLYKTFDLKNEKVRIKILTNFVNCIYLYDDHIIIYFNIQNSKLVSYVEMLEDTEQLDENKMVRIDGDNGGEIGIRTLAGLASPNGFQDRPLQPLGYFSVISGFGVFLEPIRFHKFSLCSFECQAIQK